MSESFADRWSRKEREYGLAQIAAEMVPYGHNALPDSAAPCLTFKQAARPIAIFEVFGCPSDWSPADRARLALFTVIGSDGAGNPICVEQGTGKIMLLDHEDRFRTMKFVNSSVGQLAECLLAYMG